ncbi:MAG: TonB-dependent receptor plug domain-containing protein [Chitinophagaceae bacterium]|nr:TonB-dependent receptor plug domain-containing protein [Chitinophagaceae bacterium]
MQYRFRSIVSLVILLLGSFQATKAQVTKGKVVDAISRQPLESVSVTNANAPAIKTTTDQNGDFILRSGNQLMVSFVGYKAATISVEKQEGNIIALQPDVVSLKDVVLQSNATTKFSTLSKVDLELKPVRNTQELLRLVPGLFIAQHAGGGKAEQIFLRGFDCDHGTDVQVSVDGMPVNMVSHAHGQGYADSHFIIPETINNIDFGAGPYYTQQGNLNTAGYVSFSTYKNISKSIVQVEAGRFNSFRTLAMVDLLKKNKDKQSAYIAADFNYTDGPTISKQNFKRLNLFGKYNLAISENTNLTASLSSFSSKWNASGQVPERAVADGTIDRFGSIDPSEGGNTERHNANVVLTTNFKNGSSWENQAFYSRYKFNLYSNFTFYLNDPVNGDEINQAESRNIFGYTSKFRQKNFFANASLYSAYGAGLRYDASKDSRLSNVVKREFLSDVKRGDIKEVNAFAFVQQQLNAGKWLIDAGIRLDYFHFGYFDKLTVDQLPSQQKAIISPKLNIQYTVNSLLQFFVKAGKGFHSNDTRVVVANNGKEILPAAYGTDFGVILKPAKNLYLSIAAWYLYLDQEFVYVGDAGVIEPSGKSRRQGVDVTARYQFSKNLFANANINFTKPRAIDEAKGTDHIPLAPTLTSVGGIFYKAQKGFNGGISYRYIKDRPANEDNSIVAKGYFLMDASVNYTRTKYEIGLAFENIFNIKWNEAQFATESRLMNEPNPVTELHYTPGTPVFARVKFAVFF